MAPVHLNVVLASSAAVSQQHALTREARARVVWIDAHAQRSLQHILEAAKASGRVDKIGGEAVRAATGEKYLARRDAADGTIEAEPRLGGLGDERGGEQQGTQEGQQQGDSPLQVTLHLYLLLCR
jgi:hypothetical protein